MQIKQVNESFYVSQQITPEDLSAIKSQGVKTIICNRPDDEEVDQASIQSITEAAVEHDLQVKFLPAVSGNVSDAQVDEFSQMLSECNGPVLAYCRTGTRSSILWTLAQAGKNEFAETLEQTQKLGYELSHLKERFEKLC